MDLNDTKDASKQSIEDASKQMKESTSAFPDSSTQASETTILIKATFKMV